MADLLSLRGLVAAGPRATGQGPVGQARAAQRSGAITGGANALPADTVEVRAAGVPLELPGAQAELRQSAITSHEARAQAMARVTDGLADLLAGVRAGRPGALAEFREGVGALRGLVEAGPNLTELLLPVEPGAARAVDPGLVETAQVETENALAALYGEAARERRELSVALVSAENAAASRVDAERLDRAAERLRRREAEGQPAGLLEALRGPLVSRTRVVELLLT